MTAGDLDLLARLDAALLEQPFSSPVDLGGGLMLDRATARSLATHLTRLRTAERRRLASRSLPPVRSVHSHGPLPPGRGPETPVFLADGDVPAAFRAQSHAGVVSHG